MEIPAHYFGATFHNKVAKMVDDADIIHWADSPKEMPSEVEVLEFFPAPYSLSENERDDLIGFLLEHQEERAAEVAKDCDFCYIIYPHMEAPASLGEVDGQKIFIGGRVSLRAVKPPFDEWARKLLLKRSIAAHSCEGLVTGRSMMARLLICYRTDKRVRCLAEDIVITEKM